MIGLRKLIVTVFSLCAMFAAAPVYAQVDQDVQLGSKIPVRPSKADPILDGQVRDRYVSCAYAPYKEQIDAYLIASDPASADPDDYGIDTKRITRRHDLRNCFELIGNQVQASITFTPTAFRYMMLEAAYLRANRELPADHETRVAPPRSFASTGKSLELARSLAALSDCMVAHDAVNADALLRTDSGTKQEKEAAMALVPALGACITQGQDLQITVKNIRSFAADGMWQRFVAPDAETSE